MIGHLGLQRSFQNRFGQLFEQTVLPDDILGLLVIYEQLIDQLLVDCHGAFHFLPPMAVYTVLFTPSSAARETTSDSTNPFFLSFSWDDRLSCPIEKGS